MRPLKPGSAAVPAFHPGPNFWTRKAPPGPMLSSKPTITCPCPEPVMKPIGAS
jgi:hypothetical protein